LIPITDDQVEYAESVAASLHSHDLRVEVDAGRDRMQAKIRNAQLQKVPFMLIIGKREAEAGTVSVRARTGEDLGAMAIDDVASMLSELVASRSTSLSTASR
jgi:threonyl-tRNA synthetase